MGDLPLVLGFFTIFEEITTLQMIVFIVGLLLLLAEIFSPGFGVAGGSGLLLLIIGIAMTARNVTDAVIMVLILLALIALMLFFIIRSARRGRLSKKLILRSAARHDDGYSTTADESLLIGRKGVALTILRPAGTGDFDGRRLDVVTEGGFIDKGSAIKIVRTEGRRIVVERVEISVTSDTMR